VATIAICIVFVPMFMLAGIAGYLFVPFAEAVVFAMLASYVLSVTLVLTLAKYWLKPHAAHATGRGIPARFLARFESGFDRYAAGITPCWRPRCAAARALPVSFCWDGATAILAFRSESIFRASGRISFPPSTPARSCCICEPEPACASRKRQRCAMP